MSNMSGVDVRGFVNKLFISNVYILKGALDKYNIIPQLFQKKVGIFNP